MNIFKFLVHWMLIPLFCVFLVKTVALFYYGWVDILMTVCFSSQKNEMKFLTRERTIGTD